MKLAFLLSSRTVSREADMTILHEKILVLASVLALGMTIGSSTVWADDEGDGRSAIAKGAALYSLNCGRCHNPRLAQEFSGPEWSVVMPHMREKSHMTGTETSYVEAFLSATLTSEKVSGVESRTNGPVTPDRGRTLVSDFGCQGCHVIGGEGGEMGPSLDGVVARKGSDHVRQKIAKPTFNNAASTMPAFPFSMNDIESIVKFLEKGGE